MKPIKPTTMTRGPCLPTCCTGSQNAESGQSINNFALFFQKIKCLPQRSLGSILMPPAPVGFKRMRREQEKAFEKRTDDLLAVFVYLYLYFYICLHLYLFICLFAPKPTQTCTGEYPRVSKLYWLRSLLAIGASLLLILVGFVLWPVHDVLLDQSYWLNDIS